MTEIILARHGETEWNVSEVFRGRADIPLNQTGIKQAELLAQFLDGRKIEAVYSSPLKRALKTAEIIAARHKLDVQTAPGLIDFDFGEWNGLSLQDVKGRYSRVFAVWAERPQEARIPGGETLDGVTKRAMSVVTEVVKKHQATVVLVSHRVVNKVLILALLGLDNSRFWSVKVDTAGITIFDYDKGRFVLTKHNDTSYLEPLRKAPLRDF
jgi:broad specificity phosphatase PhoE